MSINRDLEVLFCFFGFTKCSSNDTINFKKLSEESFLVVRTFSRNKIVDLLLEKYKIN